MKITIGSDHRGYELKSKLIEHFKDIEWIDVGTSSTERTDYPIYAKKVCQNILDKKSDVGVLICGSGVGMAVAANRFRGIFAALCWNEQVAKLAKEHDDGNVLVLAADFIDEELAAKIFKAWLFAKFKGEGYQKRLDMIDEK